jgi:hypothetical protein
MNECRCVGHSGVEVRSFTGPKIKGKFQMKLQKFQEFADFASKK